MNIIKMCSFNKDENALKPIVETTC